MGLLLPVGAPVGNPRVPGLPGEWLRSPLPAWPAWATHLPAPLLDGADGQRALDAPVPPQEHLPLVGLVELRLNLGLGGLHAQADHLGKGNGSSAGAAPESVRQPRRRSCLAGSRAA